MWKYIGKYVTCIDTEVAQTFLASADAFAEKENNENSFMSL